MSHYMKPAPLDENLPNYTDWGAPSSAAGTSSTHSQSHLANHLGSAIESSHLQNKKTSLIVLIVQQGQASFSTVVCRSFMTLTRAVSVPWLWLNPG